MKIKIDAKTGIFALILLASILIRFWGLDSVGYVTDEPVIITAGIKHFLNNPYPVSLYDMATPGGQWPIGLFVTSLSDKDFGAIRDYGIMDYVSIDNNPELLMGLEFYARLPSAILGVLSGLIIYLLVKEMYGRKSALVSYALFSFCPIIVDYSRIALLEIYQIFYMLGALYLFYLYLTQKKNKYAYLTGSSVFIGLTGAAKLNGLMLIPLFMLFSIVPTIKIKKKKNELNLDILGFLKNSAIILGVSFLVLGVVFNFDFNTPFQVYNYYSSAGGAGLRFVLFQLLIDSLFFINPLVWVLLCLSVYYFYKQRRELGINDLFALLLLVIIFASGFFEAHANIKRGIQYILLIFIICGKLYSMKLEKKWLNYIPVIIVLLNLGLILYYFPNTGLAKNILCTSQECLDAHGTRNFNSRLVGEYINSLSNAVVYDTTDRTGLIGFYLDEYWDYMPGGVARYMLGTCPTLDILKENGFTHVVNNSGCANVLWNDLADCSYESMYVRNYEMVQVYDIRGC